MGGHSQTLLPSGKGMEEAQIHQDSSRLSNQPISPYHMHAHPQTLPHACKAPTHYRMHASPQPTSPYRMHAHPQPLPHACIPPFFLVLADFFCFSCSLTLSMLTWLCMEVKPLARRLGSASLSSPPFRPPPRLPVGELGCWPPELPAVGLVGWPEGDTPRGRWPRELPWRLRQ